CDFGDRQVPLVERLGLGVPALGAIEFGEVVEGLAEGGVVGAQRLFGDRQVPLVERLGLGVPALSLVNICQPGNRRGVFCVVLAMVLAGQGYVPLGYRYGRGVLALLGELADLRSQIGELVSPLRARLVRA